MRRGTASFGTTRSSQSSPVTTPTFEPVLISHIPSASPAMTSARPQQAIGLGVETMVTKPIAEHVENGRLVGQERNEVEPTPQGRVDERDRPVRGVHRADDIEVRRQGERFIG